MVQSMSQISRASSTQSTQLENDWFYLPPSHYDKLQIGVFESRNLADGRGRLDDLLAATKLPYEEYLLYCEATKISPKKPSVRKLCFLILTTEGIITLRTDEESTVNSSKKITRYSYLQIESVTQLDSATAGTFSFALNFYNKDLDVKKIKQVKFTCKESQHVSERELNVPRRKTILLSDMFEGAEQSTKPLQFSVIYLITKQLPIGWQKLFEEKLGMSPNLQSDLPQLQKEASSGSEGKKKGGMTVFDPEDFYQFHGYVYKKNRFFRWDKRFIVLTNKWMINVDAGFADDRCLTVTFKKTKWRAPLAAMTGVEIITDKDGIYIKCKFHKEKQIDILTQHGYQPADKKALAKIKEKRKLLFVDVNSARDFVFQLKRIHHLWNNSLHAQYSDPMLTVKEST